MQNGSQNTISDRILVFGDIASVSNSARTIATIKTTKMADNTMVVPMSSDQHRHNEDPFPIDYGGESTDRSLNNNDNQRLMNLIRQHKILYECSNSHEQRVKELKEDAWRQISIDFGGDIPTWELARRYKNIRTAFGRFLRRSIKRQDGSIRSLEKSSWGFLAWLKPYIKHKFDYDEESYSSIVDTNKIAFPQPPSFAVFHSRTPLQHQQQNHYIKHDNDASVNNACFDNNATPTVVDPSSCSVVSGATVVEINNVNANNANNNSCITNGNNSSLIAPNFQPNSGFMNQQDSRASMANNISIADQKMSQQQQQKEMSSPKRKRTIQDVENASRTMTIRSEHELLQQRDDEDTLFLRSLIPQMKRVTPEKKFEVKTKIMKILHDAEFGQEDVEKVLEDS